MKNKDVSDPEKIKKMIAHGEFVKKEIEALYMLKKYRTLKRRYNDENQQISCTDKNYKRFYFSTAEIKILKTLRLYVYIDKIKTMHKFIF